MDTSLHVLFFLAHNYEFLYLTITLFICVYYPFWHVCMSPQYTGLGNISVKRIFLFIFLIYCCLFCYYIFNSCRVEAK